MTETSLLVAVSASIVFPPPGASEENGLPHTSTRTQLPQSMKIMHEIMYKLEVLYVLCVLLMGRQRNQVSPSPRLRTGGARSKRFPGACGVSGILFSSLSAALSLAQQSKELGSLALLHRSGSQSDSRAHSLSTIPDWGNISR